MSDDLEFEEQVRLLRTRYLAELEQFFPWRLDALGIPLDYLFGQSRFLGEFYCLWLAPPLGIRDAKRVQNLGVATVLARAHAVISDCLADGAPCEKNLSHAASIFLAEGLARFAAEVSDQRGMWDLVRRYLCLNAECDLGERRRHWNVVAPYSARDMRALGEKTSICFLPAAVLASEARRSDLIPALELMIATRNVAVQLRDDIADWRDDIAVGNFTLPITLSLSMLGVRSPADMERGSSSAGVTDCLANALYGTDIVDVLLDLSTLYLDSSMRQAKLIEANRIGSYLEAIKSSNFELKRAFGDLREQFGLPRERSVLTIVRDESWPTVQLVRTADEPALSEPMRSAFDQLGSQLSPKSGLT